MTSLQPTPSFKGKKHVGQALRCIMFAVSVFLLVCLFVYLFCIIQRVKMDSFTFFIMSWFVRYHRFFLVLSPLFFILQAFLSFHSFRNCSHLMPQDKTLKRRIVSEGESRGEIRGFISIGASPPVISGHNVVIEHNRLQYSDGTTFSFTCKPSINHGHRHSAFTTLGANRHTISLSHTHLHTQMLLLEWKQKLKKMNAANSHLSGQKNSNRSSTELRCRKACNICNSLWAHRQSAITGNTVSAASQQVCSLFVLSLKVPSWDFSADCCFIVKVSATLWSWLYWILFGFGRIVLISALNICR